HTGDNKRLLRERKPEEIRGGGGGGDIVDPIDPIDPITTPPPPKNSFDELRSTVANYVPGNSRKRNKVTFAWARESIRVLGKGAALEKQLEAFAIWEAVAGSHCIKTPREFREAEFLRAWDCVRFAGGSPREACWEASLQEPLVEIPATARS